MFRHASLPAPAERPNAASGLRRVGDVVSSGGHRIAAFEGGRSDADTTIVLVHGLGHWAQAAWDPLVATLAPTHRLIAFDVPGFGDSDKPDVRYTLHTLTGALETVVDAFSSSARFALVGHSFGGLIAANFAARRPARLRALALLDPPGFLRTPKIVLRVAGSRPVASLFRNITPSRRFIESTLDASVYDSRSVDPQTRGRAIALSRDPTLRRAFARVYSGAMHDMLRLRSLHRRFAAWDGTTLLVWGKDDRYVPFAGLAPARNVYPQAAVLAIDRCGHCPAVEYPELVARALRALAF